MISYALIANGQHNPYLSTPLPEHMIYPISRHCDQGIDLDYGALILGRKFIIDEAVYYDVISSRKDYLTPMKQSLKKLKRHNLLKTIDYSSIFDANKSQILAMTKQLLESPEQWLRLEQEQWRTLEPELQVFQRNYGSPEMFECNTTNIGIESWLARTNQYHNQYMRNELYSLFRGLKRFEDVDIENVKGSLEYIVAQIVMSDLISNKLGSPILDWDDSDGLYQRLNTFRWDNQNTEMKLHEQVTKLFDIVIPELKPNCLDEVIKFVSKNQNVQSLRKAGLEAIEKGEELDKQWLDAYIREMCDAQINMNSISSKFSLFGAAVGLIPVPWGLGAAATGTGVVVDKIIHRDERKYQWYYALKGQKHSKKKWPKIN